VSPLVAEPRHCLLCGRRAPFPRLFRDRVGFQLVRCPDCGLVFQDPPPDPALLRESYYHDPEFTRLLQTDLRPNTLSRAREKLGLLQSAGAVRSGMRLLDVGCSSGAWLEVAAESGLPGVGVEVGASTAAAAREQGLDVRTGTLEDALGAGTEQFDLITFWDVLEHLSDPLGTLRHAVRLLAPGGVVAATFPNVAGLYPQMTLRLLARTVGVWEHPELPLHLYDFSPATARRVFSLAGLEPFALRTQPTDFQYLRATALSPARLHRGRRDRLARLAFEGIRVVAYPLGRLLGRGNTMFILGRARSGS
jgi:SAM-dependent methyltransferase